MTALQESRVRSRASTLGVGLRFFAAPRGQPRARRGTDVVLLVLALVGLGLAITAYPPSSLERSFLAFLAALPGLGGIGVAEFGYTVGLTSAGMTAEAAIAAVLLYRIATYYLPPLWGFPAMLWLQRNRYL